MAGRIRGNEVGAHGALDEIPGHEADAVDQAHGGDAFGAFDEHRVDISAGFEPREAMFAVILLTIAVDHVGIAEIPARCAGADEDE